MIDYSKLQDYKIPHYVLFLFLFSIVNILSMWGQYVTLPYVSLSAWEAYKMAIPFAWLDWIVMTFTIAFGHKHKLFTPTQITFLLIIMQFGLVLVINEFYLKKNIYRSDIIAFFIILIGFIISFLHIISKAMNIPIDKGDKNKDQSKKEETN